MRSSSSVTSPSRQLLNAARQGNYSLFVKLLESNPTLDVTDIVDGDGNGLLVNAAYYDDTMSSAVITRKKKIVRQLLKFFAKDSVQFKKTLNLVAEKGCYQTGKELLSVNAIKNEDSQSAFEMSILNGHQRIERALKQYGKSGNKNVTTNSLYNYSGKGTPLIIQEARNLEIGDDDFLKNLKECKDIEYVVKGKTLNAIDVRIDSLRKKYRSRNIKIALLGALCPAMAMAVFFATFGGVYPDPILASILTVAILPIVFIPMAYISYKAHMKEFGSVAAETLHLNWRSSRLAAQKHDFSEKLEKIATQITQYKNQLAEVDSKEEFELVQKALAETKKEYKELQASMAKVVEFDEEKKPKIALKYMSRENFKAKKDLGLYDSKSNEKWTSKGESVRAFAGYSAEVMCAVDGGLALGSVLAGIFVSKVGLGFLGATAASFLAGPVGIAVVLGASALILAVGFGVLLYNASYKHEMKDIGKLNRELVFAHDTCKKSADLCELNEQRKKVDNSFRDIDQDVDAKSKLMEKNSPPPKSPSLSSVKLSDSSLVAKGFKDEETAPLQVNQENITESTGLTLNQS